jgi:drug/metabolite transporter (DMT)-like permease
LSITVNPIASALFAAAVLNEPITANLIIGLIIIATGIVIATSNGSTIKG